MTNERELLGWPYLFFYYAFLVMGFVTFFMTPLCYAPQHVEQLLGKAGVWLLGLPLVKIATADRSGASLACLTLAFLALARFFVLWKRREHQEKFLRWWGKKPENLAAMEGHARQFPATDPVHRYFRSVYQTWGMPGDGDDGHIELLHRGMMREDLRLRQMVTPLVVLGLLGTLMGVFIGFILTFATNQGIELDAALRQAVVVVATACLSSVWGIGLGQLLVGPLADHLGRRTNEVFDHAIALDSQLRVRKARKS